jgi:hypothetical protein
MTEAGSLRLLGHHPSWSTVKISRPSWPGGGICASSNTPWVIINEWVKIKKEYCESNIPAGFFSGAQGESDSGVVENPFSGFHLICEMATLLT